MAYMGRREFSEFSTSDFVRGSGLGNIYAVGTSWEFTNWGSRIQTYLIPLALLSFFNMYRKKLRILEPNC